MKIIRLLLTMTSISVAQAEIYKCPGKVEGQYTYQEKPCKGAKPDEHTLKVVPFDAKKIQEAQEKLAKEIDADKNKDAQSSPDTGSVDTGKPALPPPANPMPAPAGNGTATTPPVPQKPSNPATSTNTNGTNTSTNATATTQGSAPAPTSPNAATATVTVPTAPATPPTSNQNP